MDRILTFLSNYALDHNISFQFKSFESTEVPVSNSNMRMIIMNSNWHNPAEIPFQFAHEIAHILNEDIGSNNYSAGAFYSKEECNANEIGIDILLKYCEMNDIRFKESTKFMESFGIPSILKNTVDERLKRFIGISYPETMCEI